MYRAPNSEVDRLLRHLTEELGRQFSRSLVGLYVHGSLVAGDFDVTRSDIDLLAVLTKEPDDAGVEKLRDLHGGVEQDFSAWRDRVEVTYVTEAAMTATRTGEHRIVRVSPGEPLHRTLAGREYLLNWFLVRTSGVALLGPPPRDIVPEVSPTEFTEVVRLHARGWPTWIADMRHPGGQAYAVLTLCRALHAVRTGEQLSKKQAAREGRTLLPRWRPLIDWALGWWYGGGAQTPDQDHHPEVVVFVEEVSRLVQEQEGPLAGPP